MTDVPSSGPRIPAFKLPRLNEIVDVFRSGDIVLALGVMAIIVVLILPMPAMLLDVLLAISIVFSVLILMTVLFIEKPLELSTFPTILLISTMIRLSLNLASTRLILAHGHEGKDAAGHVIEAFGSFVMQDVGVFENGVTKGHWTILPGLGSGELASLRGDGHFSATHDGARYMLNVAL